MNQRRSDEIRDGAAQRVVVHVTAIEIRRHSRAQAVRDLQIHDLGHVEVWYGATQEVVPKVADLMSAINRNNRSTNSDSRTGRSVNGMVPLSRLSLRNLNAQQHNPRCTYI